ncbi:hypothetical protein [Marinicella meishanensis]|uniref:hypothetical protein n=1 Tax=Marinicella meishanensis TaxID=2873263 RepID=UPI001CC081C2|nr:hypothetical protein [Marinicella sp. NBU2979]
MDAMLIYALLAAVLLLLLVLVVVGVHLNRRLKDLHAALQDLAQSQRILANNPKNFEETKRINALKKNPYD